MIDHGRAINKAAPTARVLVVTSPCNTNCLIAMTHAHDVPREHWFALNQVFRMRAIAMVAAKGRRSGESGHASDGLGKQQRNRLRGPDQRTDRRSAGAVR